MTPAVGYAPAMPTAEHRRLDEARSGIPWRRWGPYLSERQWGTVREDESPDGNAWDWFPHDHARSRAYRWGEDGLAGFSDDSQQVCLGIALWNEADPILKERLFGLTNEEGNHGEDVKELYFYLDALPTSAYLRWRYVYPQRAYPYDDLVRTNAARGRLEPEYELLDTGVLDEDRYWDVDVEYGKEDTEEIAWRITARNRGPEEATLHLLPTVWFRNTWWQTPGARRPALTATGPDRIRVDHPELGTMWLVVEGPAELVFCDNETNPARHPDEGGDSAYPKDAFHRLVIDGEEGAVNPDRTGTKAAAWIRLRVPAGGEAVARLWFGREADRSPGTVDGLLAARLGETDEFYAALTPDSVDAEQAAVMRQALAGMFWSMQWYGFDLDRWLRRRGFHPLMGSGGLDLRNRSWYHLAARDVISMPDAWEYPWFAAWDLAFHVLPIAIADPDLAKSQLELLLRERYRHPNGQIPAYEWNFSDVNPPVQAWAAMYLYDLELANRGQGDFGFLARMFERLDLNFSWWVNRKDRDGRNVYEGGFLGLDNIGVFDRSKPLPTGGYLEQADGTAWMAFYAQMMMSIALRLAEHEPMYEEAAARFAEHVLFITAAFDRIGEHADEMWDEGDGFFYDVLRLPDGSATRLGVRSLVGLLPMTATIALPEDVVGRFPLLVERVRSLRERYPEIEASMAPFTLPGVGGRRLVGPLDEVKLRRILARMLDEDEFLSPSGIRSLSKAHADHPYEFWVGGEAYRVVYTPGESDSGMFGGNSNWRGPIWMPTNVLVIRALLNLYAYHGDELRVECPTGSGVHMTLFEVAAEISRRLVSIFLPGPDGHRPVHGGEAWFEDPSRSDLVLFYEYFHGDSGAGLGASHQTGWTGLVALLISLFGRLDPAALLAEGRVAAMRQEG
jgi:hypothetical protein